ncbi:MAG: hypothetical protein LBI34_02105 [Puniceicoccales bacterium]|jgi:hypothetical protein|nr:hypothetical protein [Puniceicoccales bacterium]
MPIKLITLRQSFDRIFTGKNAVDYAALIAMIEIEDSFNDGSYTLDPTIASHGDAVRNYLADANGNLVIFNKTTDADGNAIFTAVGTPDELISSTIELFVKANNTNNKYVQIHSLKKLDPRLFRAAGSQGFLRQYINTALRICAILYAKCCFQKKMLQLYINDMEAVNREQKELNYISSLVSVIQNDLRERDTGVESVDARHLSTLYAAIIVFFIQRGLLDTTSSGTVINTDLVNTLKGLALGKAITTLVDQISVLTLIDQNAATASDLVGAFACGEDNNSELFAVYNSLSRVFSPESDSRETDSTQIVITADDIIKAFAYGHNVTLEHIIANNYEMVATGNGVERVLPNAFFSGAPSVDLNPGSDYDSDSDFNLDSDYDSDPDSDFDSGSRLEPVDHLTNFLNFLGDASTVSLRVAGSASAEVSISKNEIFDRWNILRAAHSGTLTDEMLEEFASTYFDDTIQDSESVPVDLAAVVRHVCGDTFGRLQKMVSHSVTSTLLGGNSLGLVDSFRAWTQLQVLLRHYDTFFGSGPASRLLPEGVAISNDINLDVLSSAYWVKAFDSSNNTFKGVIGLGDHWVFDPRIRLKNGELLNAASGGSDVYFRGFSAVNTGRNCENLATIYDSGGQNVGGSAPANATNFSPEYSVSWFGKNPPTSVDDFENGIAGILSRSYGGKYFIDSSFFRNDASGRKVFTDAFRTALEGDESFSISLYSEGGIPRFFYVKEFAGHGISNITPNDGNTGSESISTVTKSAYLAMVPGQDYWPVPNGNGSSTGAYANWLKGTVETVSNDLRVSAENCSMWADTARVHTDQTNNETTQKSTAMQLALQLSQQALSMSSNLSKGISRYSSETINNIR